MKRKAFNIILIIILGFFFAIFYIEFSGVLNTEEMQQNDNSSCIKMLFESIYGGMISHAPEKLYSAKKCRLFSYIFSTPGKYLSSLKRDFHLAILNDQHIICEMVLANKQGFCIILREMQSIFPSYCNLKNMSEVPVCFQLLNNQCHF